MNLRIVKNIILVVGIVLLSLAVTIQPVLTDDDDDQGDADYEECAPLITGVQVNFETDSMIIDGECLAAGPAPLVHMDGVELPVYDYSASLIETQAPTFPDGGLSLSVCVAERGDIDEKAICDRFYLHPSPDDPSLGAPITASYGGVLSTYRDTTVAGMYHMPGFLDGLYEGWQEYPPGE